MGGVYGIYVTPEELKSAELGTTRDSHDESVAEFCLNASRTLEFLCAGARFYPTKQTRYYDHRWSDKLVLDEDLLEVISITTNNGNTTITEANAFLQRGLTYNEGPPYDRIVLDTSSSDLFYYSTTPQRANAVTGFWGHIESWDSCWVDTNLEISAWAASSFTLSALPEETYNVHGQAPAVGLYNLVRWYDSDTDDMEMAFVTGVSGTTLTVERGVNGTSVQATPGSNKSLYVFKPDRQVHHVARRLASWLWHQKGDVRNDNDRPRFIDGQIVLPSAWPRDVLEFAETMRGVTR